MIAIKQGGVYRYGTQWDEPEIVVACERDPANDNYWICYVVDSGRFTKVRSIYDRTLHAIEAPQPQPRLVTWYRPKVCRDNLTFSWASPTFWYRSEAAARLALPGFELFGMETMEAPE